MSDTDNGWSIANAVEYSIAFAALKPLWLICLIAVRRRNDELRKPFLWLKCAIPLYLLFAALEITRQGINIILKNQITYSLGLLIAADHIAVVTLFIDDFADIFMLLCLVEVNLNSLRALGSLNYHNGIRFCNFMAVSVLAILAITTLSSYESWLIKSNYGNEILDWSNVAHLYATIIIIWWILSVPIIALSISVLVIANKRQRLRGIGRRLLAVSILNFVRSTYELYYAATYLVNWSWLQIFPSDLAVIEPILYFWLTVAMIGILVAIGMQKKEGLWTEKCQQQAPKMAQRQANDSGTAAGVYDCGHGREAAPVTLAQYKQQQAQLIGNYNTVWRLEPAAFGHDQQKPVGVNNSVSPQSSLGSPPHY